MRRSALFAFVLLVSCCGPRVEPRAHPERVVTLAPNVTEIVFALGSGDRVAGTDDFSNLPPEAARLPKVGRMQPDLEKIAALRPDLVIGITAGAHPNLRPALEALHIPLELIQTDRVSDVPRAMWQIGTRLGSARTNGAIRMLRDSLGMQKRIRTRSPRVLFTVWTDPLYVGGRNTLADDLLRIAGATNAIEATGWTQASLETVLASPPDIILYVDRSIARTQIDALLARGVRGEAIAVDEDLFTRAGPRLPQAAARLNAILDRWEQKRAAAASIATEH